MTNIRLFEQMKQMTFCSILELSLREEVKMESKHSQMYILCSWSLSVWFENTATITKRTEEEMTSYSNRNKYVLSIWKERATKSLLMK